MPPLLSLPSQKQAALDAIAPSFHLTNSKLKEITKRFLEEFAMGITAYNHPMAMIRMHDCIASRLSCLTLRFSNFRDRNSQRLGKGVGGFDLFANCLGLWLRSIVHS
jgi:hypothetical protein